MNASERMLKELETPEGKAKMDKLVEEFVKREKVKSEKIKSMMSDTTYMEWLNRFTQDKERFYDDDWLYFPERIEDADRENVEKLFLFYEGIREYAEQVHFYPTPCECGDFYKVRLNESGFKIGILFGQGTVFFCEKIPVENEEEFIDFNNILKMG